MGTKRAFYQKNKNNNSVLLYRNNNNNILVVVTIHIFTYYVLETFFTSGVIHAAPICRPCRYNIIIKNMIY